jgi:hypothetical protein
MVMVGVSVAVGVSAGVAVMVGVSVAVGVRVAVGVAALGVQISISPPFDVRDSSVINTCRVEAATV